MKKKNILLITGQFLPFTKSIGGIIRILSFCNSLEKKFNINIVSTGNQYYGYFGFKKNIKSYNLINIKKKFFFFYLIFGFFKKFFPNLAYLFALDYAHSYRNELFKAVKVTIKKKKIKYIVISCPPFSLFYIGDKIRKEYNDNIKIIYDYRDGWFSRFNDLDNSYLISKLKKNLEDRIIKSAHSIVCATETIYKKIKYKNKVLITNGYYSLPSDKKIIISNTIKIGYFGLISDDPKGYRDINILFNALKGDEFKDKKFKFYFYGNNDISKSNIRNYKNFIFNKNLDYFEAQNMMQQMDYLLIIHTEQSTVKEVITGKFYEYVSTRKPIISITNGEAEVNKIINQSKLGYTINIKKKNLSKELLKILRKRKKYKMNIKDIFKYSREYQNKKLLDILKD